MVDIIVCSDAVDERGETYHQYTHINQVWDMHMPSMPDDTVSQGVLGGSMKFDVEDDETEEVRVECIGRLAFYR